VLLLLLLLLLQVLLLQVLLRWALRVLRLLLLLPALRPRRALLVPFGAAEPQPEPKTQQQLLQQQLVLVLRTLSQTPKPLPPWTTKKSREACADASWYFRRCRCFPWPRR
jgi:hypothetical protein